VRRDPLRERSDFFGRSRFFVPPDTESKLPVKNIENARRLKVGGQIHILLHALIVRIYHQNQFCLSTLRVVIP
jgi:hypothetical protein